MTVLLLSRNALHKGDMFKTLDQTKESGFAQAVRRRLEGGIIGQQEGIDATVATIERINSRLVAPNRPLGSLLFLGPTGVGKTHIVELLAETLYGRPDAFLKAGLRFIPALTGRC